MSPFVTCSKQTLDESPVSIKLSGEVIVEAKSDLEMSKELSRFREHLRQSFELYRKEYFISPFHEVLKAFKQNSQFTKELPHGRVES